MNTQTLNLIVAFVATFVVGLFVMPILKKFKVGQVVRDDGPKEHLKKQGTPTMGGIIMLIVIVVILAINSIKYPRLWQWRFRRNPGSRCWWSVADGHYRSR